MESKVFVAIRLRRNPPSSQSAFVAIRLRRNPPLWQAGGLPDFSRWLSEPLRATPPVSVFWIQHPGGMPDEPPPACPSPLRLALREARVSAVPVVPVVPLPAVREAPRPPLWSAATRRRFRRRDLSRRPSTSTIVDSHRQSSPLSGPVARVHARSSPSSPSRAKKTFEFVILLAHIYSRAKLPRSLSPLSSLLSSLLFPLLSSFSSLLPHFSFPAHSSPPKPPATPLTALILPSTHPPLDPPSSFPLRNQPSQSLSFTPCLPS